MDTEKLAEALLVTIIDEWHNFQSWYDQVGYSVYNEQEAAELERYFQTLPAYRSWQQIG